MNAFIKKLLFHLRSLKNLFCCWCLLAGLFSQPLPIRPSVGKNSNKASQKEVKSHPPTFRLPQHYPHPPCEFRLSTLKKKYISIPPASCLQRPNSVAYVGLSLFPERGIYIFVYIYVSMYDWMPSFVVAVGIITENEWIAPREHHAFVSSILLPGVCLSPRPFASYLGYADWIRAWPVAIAILSVAPGQDQ